MTQSTPSSCRFRTSSSFGLMNNGLSLQANSSKMVVRSRVRSSAHHKSFLQLTNYRSTIYRIQHRLRCNTSPCTSPTRRLHTRRPRSRTRGRGQDCTKDRTRQTTSRRVRLRQRRASARHDPKPRDALAPDRPAAAAKSRVG